MKPRLDRSYAPSDSVVARAIEGEWILVPLHRAADDPEAELYSLNEPGRAIWERLDGATPTEQIIEALEREFDAPRAAIEGDVMGFLEELLRRGFVQEQA